ncbi:MAG: hypothetical protein CVU44_07995 [Chloroflexi bacterium HGW-Chloroflexi-6]|nr:MAG: hypothetical protein CVU44_07995 [Chloroflexi bacterium HGW-Chloroflexi-6]
MTDKNVDALLREYDICDRQVERADNQTWQMASVILPLSVAGFAYFGMTPNHTPELFLILLVVAIGSITLITTWWLLARSRNTYRYVALYRMREIESELGLWHYHYTYFIGKSRKEQKTFVKELKDNKQRYQALESQVNSTTHFGFRRITSLIAFMFIAGWLILLIREIILTF